MNIAEVTIQHLTKIKILILKFLKCRPLFRNDDLQDDFLTSPGLRSFFGYASLKNCLLKRPVLSHFPPLDP